MTAFDIFPDFTGSMIANGRYRFLEKLGAGSFGAVYLAVDELTHGPSKPLFYAIKCLRRFAPGSRRDIIQAREFDMQQRVHRHTNIVKLREIYSDNEFHYVVLDYYAGGDLCSAIQHGIFIGNTELIKTTFIQILDAIEHCQRRHVSHRDLKPDNILLSADKTKPYIADFGLAYQGLYSDEFGTGTKAYMAPECNAWNRDIVKSYSPLEADIWSLGIILANMITGVAPWSKALPSDNYFNAFLHDPYFFHTRLYMSSEAADLLDMILQVDPETRPSPARIREEVLKINSFFPQPITTPIDSNLDYSLSQIPPVITDLLSIDLQGSDIFGCDTIVSIPSEDITALRISEWANSPVGVDTKATGGHGNDKDFMVYSGQLAGDLNFPMPPSHKPAPIGLGIFI